MTRSLAEGIVTQAIKDLIDNNEEDRSDAIVYFVKQRHVPHCERCGIDAKALYDKVLLALCESGVRRVRIVRDILEDIPRTRNISRTRNIPV